jgi:hypothetical protein
MPNSELEAIFLALLPDPTADANHIAAAAIQLLRDRILGFRPPLFITLKPGRGVVLLDLRNAEREQGLDRIVLLYATEAQVEQTAAFFPDDTRATLLSALSAYDPRFEVLVMVLVRKTWVLGWVTLQTQAA